MQIDSTSRDTMSKANFDETGFQLRQKLLPDVALRTVTDAFEEIVESVIGRRVAVASIRERNQRL